MYIDQNEANAIKFEVVISNEPLTNYPGFTEALWVDVELNIASAMKAIEKSEYAFVKIEQGSMDGPKYSYKQQRQDSRVPGVRLIQKKAGGSPGQQQPGMQGQQGNQGQQQYGMPGQQGNQGQQQYGMPGQQGMQGQQQYGMGGQQPGMYGQQPGMYGQQGMGYQMQNYS